MGNTNSSEDNSPSASRRRSVQSAGSKQIQISTERPDGSYFAGERLTGRVEIPVSSLKQHLRIRSTRKLMEYLQHQSLANDIIIELVGDATYSSEVDAAADSDGHSTHTINICRQMCFFTIDPDMEKLLIQNNNYAEECSDRTTNASCSQSNSKDLSLTLPTSIKGIFQLQIPQGFPPSLINNRTPSVIYTLELNLSTSRYRYQIPILINSIGTVPHSTIDAALHGRTTSQWGICLQASLSKRCYQPGEPIHVQIGYSNPQQRFIRSIQVTLLQFYRIHHDEHRLQLDGKEWAFDLSAVVPQQEWLGETLLQLPGPPLQGSFSNQHVGTTKKIECELDYRIFIELNERKGDNLHLTMPSINVAYQIHN